MYSFLSQYMAINQIAMLAILFGFLLTFFCLCFPFPFLPKDHGREFAVNGALSKGKIRGIGLILTAAFIITTLLFLPFSREYIVYCIILFAMMLSGYLDDAAKNPWSDYKKGAIDLVLALLAMWNFVNYNSTTVRFGTFIWEIPVAVYFILGVALIWISINVTNCSDGVDGLCASVCCVSFSAFGALFSNVLQEYAVSCLVLVAILLAYLCFNANPSSMLMGDAGSRALGFYLAIIAMKTGHPFIYLLLAAVLIVDGGIGLVKIFLLRFFKIAILKNTRTPLHDHARKEKGWSDTQVVFRFAIIQIVFVMIAGILCCR